MLTNTGPPACPGASHAWGQAAASDAAGGSAFGMQPTRAGSSPASSTTSSRTAGLTANEPSAKRQYSRRPQRHAVLPALAARQAHRMMTVAEDHLAGPAVRPSGRRARRRDWG